MCGIVGFWRADGQDIAEQLYFGLWALQHRGKESAGISVWNPRNGRIHREIGEGEIVQAIPTKRLHGLRGPVGVAHNRYSTVGASDLTNAQPILGEFRGRPFALVHNGNLVNKDALLKKCLRTGFHFSTTSDTGVMAASVALSSASVMSDALIETARSWQGAFSVIVLYDGELYALRDPWGVRPLHVGVAWPQVVVASESCVTAHLRIPRSDTFDVPPAGFVHIRRDSTLVGTPQDPRLWTRPQAIQARCLFEYVYFARPDSTVDDVRVMSVRERSGEILAEEAPVAADIVLPVPDSGKDAARGYARALGVPYHDNALFRSHMVSRTFIEPIQRLRQQGVRLKFTVVPEFISGKSVVVVDDSMVRDTTAPSVVALLRSAGAKRVDWRNASPPVRFGCHYGVDTYRVVAELAMRKHHDNIEAIREESGADSLAYLSMEGLLRAVKEVSAGKLHEGLLCTACWTGEYRIPLGRANTKVVSYD